MSYPGQNYSLDFECRLSTYDLMNKLDALGKSQQETTRSNQGEGFFRQEVATLKFLLSEARTSNTPSAKSSKEPKYLTSYPYPKPTPSQPHQKVSRTNQSSPRDREYFETEAVLLKFRAGLSRHFHHGCTHSGDSPTQKGGIRSTGVNWPDRHYKIRRTQHSTWRTTRHNSFWANTAWTTKLPSSEDQNIWASASPKHAHLISSHHCSSC